ncbi:glycine betaine/L-proline ABC transporter permease ProW [Vandammella animalimorsus]|uniref:Proline/glycine betaine ABC transporter permease ProW n=1 Tax=Vandammella animalimorsus TaxID=2029117 RepID=A0A2A2AFU1_9BURK|nr:glycine betaine/L-proline ABC transporter permease ProW [Vandammella animalimorsus]PAT36611.1 proline/glycine betaine ABC transporter permease ProW [Vandammella animalimorsus]
MSSTHNDNPWAATAAPAPSSPQPTAPAPAAAAADNPWAAAPAQAPASAANPWGGGGTSANSDWLSSSPGAGAEAGAAADGFALRQLWDGSLPVQDWINQGLSWFVAHFRPFFQTIRTPIDATLSGIEQGLLSMPTLGMIAILALLAWQFAGRRVAIGALLSLLIIAMLGVWPEAMVTLALVLTSLVFCLLIGLPMGILLASSDRAQRIARPVLDAMQTTPAFVYLVPVVMLFGIGNVPGVIVTIVFALPPLVRLTNLGIRQVRPDLVEAARAYGASPLQLLAKVQLPLAMPSIMAGINQALMLSLSMVVIASMIAVGGLGQMVLRGIGRLDMGLATVGGLGIVLLAITLDRITQAMGQPRRAGQSWCQQGPLGLLGRLWRRAPAASAGHGPTAQPSQTATASRPAHGH